MFKNQKWIEHLRRHYLPYVPTPRGRPPMRWTDTQEPVSCRKCNEHWEGGDPALTIACTGCNAPAHELCRRSAGGNERVCACRDEAATQLGLLSRCEALSWDNRHVKPLLLRAAPVSTALMCRSVRTGAPVSRFVP